MIDKIFRFLEFEERSAMNIKDDPNHDRHTKYWNERYWHGYAAAMRRTQEHLANLLRVVPKE